MSKTKGFTLIEILLVVGLLVLLAGLVAPNVIRARIITNETLAQAHLNTIATAIEHYAMANGGYPTAVTALMSATPPFLSQDFFTSPYDGYIFTVQTLGAGSYAILAVPASATQGTTSYTISTGFNLHPN